MSGVATAIGVSTAVSAGIGINSSIQAGKAAGASNNRANTTFNEQQNYAQQLATLMANPSSVKDLPGYKFNFDQGSQAVARQMGASGFAGSGNEAIALEKFGAGYADSAFSTQENLLASLSGLQTATSPNSYAQTGQTGQAQSFGQMSSSLAALAPLFGGGSGVTAGDQVILASGGYSGIGPTMPAGGGYIYNTPGQ